MTRRLAMIALTAVVAVALVAGGAYATLRATGQRAHADTPLPLAITHERFNSVDTEPAVEGSSGPNGQSDARHPASTICSTTSSTANVNTDCEPTGPHNETSIAVNPTNPLNMIGSANDYQLSLNAGGSLYETIYSRAHVTFDGGKTWTTYPIDYGSYVATGDPAVAFDGSGNAYLATLGFLFSQGKSPTGVNADVLVAHSTDGGKTWSKPSRVASSTGSFGSVGTFNDKEYIAAWGNGNAIVSWTIFNDGQKGVTINSTINDVVTHDGGQTWSDGTEISGAASFCAGVQSAHSCDQATGSVPTVAADGSVYVAFIATADNATGRDVYAVVKVDPATGARIAGPFKVAGLVDGLSDYPINVDGRQTYQDSEFRTWSLGNITADPTNASHLAVVWSDMRNTAHPVPADPFVAKTNSDIGVSQSTDGGVTWSAPTILTVSGDQFMPWATYDASGKLRIGYFDRSYDPANHKYGYTLATETTAGSLTFATAQVTTALSDPSQNDRWFSGGVIHHATTFLGDYSGIAAIPGGGVALLWTDMRASICFTTRCGATEDAEYATAP